MTKIFFPLCMALLIAGAANAQQADTATRRERAHMHEQHGGQPGKAPREKNKASRNRSNKMYNDRGNNAAPAGPSDSISNRRIYKSKRTGQKATPTGQEATGTNSNQSANPKNAATGR